MCASRGMALVIFWQPCRDVAAGVVKALDLRACRTRHWDPLLYALELLASCDSMRSKPRLRDYPWNFPAANSCV
jgi:hypothetical protein